jgi:hypothetical protein
MIIDLSPASLEALANLVAAKLAANPSVSRPQLLTCAQFAVAVGRSTEWVQDRCRRRLIRTVAGRKPYRIPGSELARVLT